MAVGIREVFDLELDQKAVLSVCAVPAGDGWGLVHGTLLIVPESCAVVSWGQWRRENVDAPGP